ncbi:hypothetical protein MRX96_036655 [Rhipicephalus microplus]
MRRANEQPRKENAQLKQEMNRLAAEMTEIRKLASSPPIRHSPPQPASAPIAMNTYEALHKSSVTKCRVVENTQEEEAVPGQRNVLAPPTEGAILLAAIAAQPKHG